MGLDADTLKYLDEVKKGKPRKFAMVMKGEKIVSLIVYKKGPVEKYKKLAKEEGKGKFFYGVIDGKGQNIAFKLCREDGFDAIPGKDTKLKQHLSNEGGLKFKPTYEIVDQLPKLDDADTQVSEDEESTDSAPAEEAAAPSDPPPADLFKVRLKAILPQIKQAIGTPSGDAAKQKAAEAGAAAQSNDFVQANQLLDEIEALLSGAAGETAPPAAPPASDDSADRFKQRLAEIVPRIKQAAGTPAGDNAKLKASEAAVFSRKQHFEKAGELLDAAELALEQAGEAAAQPPAAQAVTVDELKKRIKAVLGDYQAAAAAETSVSDDLTAAFGRMQKLAGAKQFDEAARELDVVESLVEVAQSEMPGEEAAESLNVEAFRAAWKEASSAWRDASESVDSQLSSLANVLRNETNEQLRAVAEFGASAVSGNHRVALMAAMRDVETAPPEKLEPVIRKLRAGAVQFRRHIDTSPVVEAFDRNPFGLDVSIRETFGEGFDALENAFEAARG